MTSEKDSAGGGGGNRLPENGNARWGYIVVLCRFILMMLGSGVKKSLGLLIPEIVYRLRGSYAGVGFACSLPGTITLLSGPVSTFILVRLNRRQVAMFGGLFSAIFLGACAFATDITVFGLFMALSGLGHACVYHANTLLLNEYFPEKFVLVDTLTLYGSVFGVMFLPIIVERSLEAYGYSWAFIILGAITFHVVACAAALRSPDRINRRGEDLARSEREKRLNGRPTGSSVNKTEAVIDSDILEWTPNDQVRNCTQGEHLPVCKETNSGLTESKPNFDEGDKFCSDSEERNPLIYHSGYTGNTREPSYVSDTNRSADERSTHLSFRSIFEIYFKPILKEHIFLISLPVAFFHNYILNAWILFLVPHAEQVGIIQSDAVFLSTIGGIGGIVGRTLAVVLLAKQIDMTPVYVVASAICSLMFLLDAFGDDFVSLAALAFVQGLCLFVVDIATMDFLKIAVVNEDNFSTAYGLSCAIGGLGFVSTGFVTGALFDAIHSYTKIFIIIGGINVFLVANFILIKVLLRRRLEENV